MIALSLMNPEVLIRYSVGDAYQGAAPIAWIAVVSACLLTFTYLVLSALLALKAYNALWIGLSVAGLQLSGQGLIGLINADLASFVIWKLICQIALAIIIASFGLRTFFKIPNPKVS